jgi:hypothetical protein
MPPVPHNKGNRRHKLLAQGVLIKKGLIKFSDRVLVLFSANRFVLVLVSWMRVKRTKHESWRRALSSKELQVLHGVMLDGQMKRKGSLPAGFNKDGDIKFNQVVMKKNIRLKAATIAIKRSTPCSSFKNLPTSSAR